ncbi:MAG: nucleotidyltransferase family protein [Candidatus Omnitrophica bacterium]|nr:nucleotidyltransferase family protein [Candidatus Omnitrophota bacterium]
MKAIILAAGYATRLWPLTLDCPKPLLPVGGKPIIEHIIKKISRISGLSDIYVVSNAKFFNAFTAWARDYRCGRRIHIIDDGVEELDQRKGSIGDIIVAINKKKIDTDILVVAGDNLFDFSLNDFIRKSKLRPQGVWVGLFDVGSKNIAKNYGVVELNKDSSIASFEEKPARPKSTLAAMCLYYFPKDKIRMLKKYKAGNNPLDLAGSFIKWLVERETVYGRVFKGKWFDIGDKKFLNKARAMKW